MFKEMRRKDKFMSLEDSINVLKESEIGILSTICENGYPYGIPLNYVYLNNKIYFHCAVEGQKINNIKKCEKVSFCVTNNVELLPSSFSANFKSVVIFGKTKETNDQEKYNVLFEFIKKYSCEFIEEGKNYIEKKIEKVKVYEIEIEHITGKAKV